MGRMGDYVFEQAPFEFNDSIRTHFLVSLHNIED